MRDAVNALVAGRRRERSEELLQTAVKLASYGVTIDGRVASELEWLTRDHDVELSVQDGRAQLLARGRALRGTAVRLTPNTGLVGSPKQKRRGVVEARALMVPELFPGRRVKIESEHVDGVYRITEIRYVGGTAEQDWYAELTAREEAP